MELPASSTITVRPSKELRPLLLKLAKDLDKSEGQILLESAAAILTMIESGEDHVPAMVRAIRVLREHNATFSEPTRMIGRQLLRDKRAVSLYSEISAGPSLGGLRRRPQPTKSACQPTWPGTLTSPSSCVATAWSQWSATATWRCSGPRKPLATASSWRRCSTVRCCSSVFCRPRKGRARLESLNPAYAPIPWNEDARIQGVFEGRFNPAHKA